MPVERTGGRARHEAERRRLVVGLRGRGAVARRVRLLERSDERTRCCCAIADHVLANGGQLDHVGELVIVDADQRNVVPGTQAAFLEGHQCAEGHLVGHGEHGGWWLMLEECSHGGITAVEAKAAADDPVLVELDTVLPAALAKPAETSFGHLERDRVEVTADHADVTVAEFEQVFGGERADSGVVEHDRRVITDTPANGGHVDAPTGERLGKFAGYGDVDQDHAVGAALELRAFVDQSIDATGFVGADHEDVVAGIGAHGFDPGDDVREVPTAQMWDDHDHGVGSPGGQARGGRVGLVAEPIRHFGDAVPSRRRDVRQATQGPTDRCHRHSCGSRNIFDPRPARRRSVVDARCQRTIVWTDAGIAWIDALTVAVRGRGAVGGGGSPHVARSVSAFSVPVPRRGPILGPPPRSTDVRRRPRKRPVAASAAQFCETMPDTVASVNADSSDTAARRAVAARAIALIDLTDLADDHAADGIDELCARAAAHGTAAVCVWPEYVARCADALASTDVRVATVVNFPSGDDSVDAVAELTAAALGDGADDIDVVLPYRAFANGDLERPARVLDAVRAAVAAPAIVKVILESGELTEPGQVMRAAQFAVDHGADFIKTSTGKTPVGATTEAARSMLEVIAAASAQGRQVGLKPSGGIRTVDDAARYLDLADRVMGAPWASPATFRFGASGLLAALAAVVEGQPSDAPAPDSSY